MKFFEMLLNGPKRLDKKLRIVLSIALDDQSLFINVKQSTKEVFY